MPKLTQLTLPDGTTLFIEATESVESPQETGQERGRTSRGGTEMPTPNPSAIESTIRAYTSYVLNAFREVSGANVNKVTLEFGINVSAEGGIPFIASGKSGSNLKITVECTFPGKTA